VVGLVRVPGAHLARLVVANGVVREPEDARGWVALLHDVHLLPVRAHAGERREGPALYAASAAAEEARVVRVGVEQVFQWHDLALQRDGSAVAGEAKEGRCAKDEAEGWEELWEALTAPCEYLLSAVS
jgi:hypothetical protein